MSNSEPKALTERILVFPFDLLSHYLRCLELVKEYPNSEILFASSAKYDQIVHKAGYQTFAVDNFDSAFVMECAARFNFSWLNKQDIERVFLSQVRAIQLLKPQRLIGDTSPTLKMAAEFTHLPYTALMNAYMSRYYALFRPLAQIHKIRRPLSILPPYWRQSIVKFAESLSFRHIHKPFRQLRRKYKLLYVFDYLHEMEGDQNLLCDEEFLFPQKKLPKNYSVIGPLMYDPEQDDDDILKGINTYKKVILVCMGSSGNWEALRFLSSPQYSRFTIITAGDTNNTIQGSHVIAKPFVSLKNILPHCSLLICHGGNGTIYQGLKHKLPILCLTSHFEQEWNVQRLQELNLGIRINRNPKTIIDTYLKLP